MNYLVFGDHDMRFIATEGSDFQNFSTVIISHLIPALNFCATIDDKQINIYSIKLSTNDKWSYVFGTISSIVDNVSEATWLADRFVSQFINTNFLHIAEFPVPTKLEELGIVISGQLNVKKLHMVEPFEWRQLLFSPTINFSRPVEENNFAF